MALLGNLKGSAQVFADVDFYNGVATQSLRFDPTANKYLNKTPSSASNRRTFTWSGWVKISNIGAGKIFFSAYSGTTTYFNIQFTSSNTLQVLDRVSGSYGILFNSNRLFRDVSSWYHIVVAIDTTQSTESNRVKIYVNGEQITSWATSTYPSQNYDTLVNTTISHLLGQRGNSSQYHEGYMAEVNFVDGYQYDPTYFGETKNGVWVAKKYTGSYGTNGFRLEFKQTGTGTASSSTVGADTSGQDNHYTSSGIASRDSNMPDSPENNWCTLNPLELDENNSGAATLEGSLKWTNVNANIGSTFGFGTQGGKYYWEYLYVSSTDGNHYQGVTLQKDGISLTNAYSTGIALYFNDGTTRVDGTSGTGFGGQIGADNIIQFKLDLDNGTLQFGKNNTYIDALTLPTSVGGWRAGGIQAAGSGGTRIFVANYGQDSSFAGNKTAQGNTDENGLGDFYYAVPSGFLAVCSANLPEPTIGPNSATQADDHFQTVTWTGTANNDLDVDANFNPDWLWIKMRGNTADHALYDSSRGNGVQLISNSTNADATNTTNGARLTQADGGIGFEPGALGDTNSENIAAVAWLWKANGGTKTTNDASATSVGTIDSDIQTNTTAGFSIVQYEATGSAGTIAHGLSQAPTWMIVKSRDQAGTSWMVYYGDNTDYLRLENSGATIDGQSTWNDTTPTSSVFSVGVNGGDTNNSLGGSMIGYIFHAVDGYSKFANFTGNGSADGTFVYTGFRPAWVLIKNTARSADWRLHDIARQPTNDDGGHILLPNSTSSEVTSEYDIDFLSNGFKLRSGDVYENGDGELLTYAAFAEDPFKYANAK